MSPETRNPTARGGAAGNLDALGGALDDRHFSLSPSQNLAVALIAASGFSTFSPKELAVYRNRAGSIVIRQERSWDADEDSFVYISDRTVALAVIAAIKRYIGGGDG